MKTAVRVALIATICAAIGGSPIVIAQTTNVATVMTKALVARDSLPAAEGSLWRFDGPAGVGQGAHPVGVSPYAGRINEVAIDPGDAFTWYATSPNGGLWKTSNAGETWAARSAGWRMQSATAVAIDPNHRNVIYVGTGDIKRADHTEPFSVGIERSFDGGLSWKEVGAAQMSDFPVGRIVVDPQNSSHVLAATGRGSRLPGGHVFLSTDMGSTWASVAGLPNANWDDLELCDSHLFWAAATQKTDITSEVGGGSGLLFRSSDGVNWQRVSLATGSFNLDTASPLKIHIACGPVPTSPVSNAVFVAVAVKDALAQIFMTLNHGVSWQQVGTLAAGGGSWARGAFGITSKSLLFANTGAFVAHLPTFAGAQLSFQQVGGLPGDVQCAMAMPTDPDTFLLCDDKGLYRAVGPGFSASSLNGTTLGILEIWRMDVHPRQGGLVAMSEQDFGDSVNFFGEGGSAAAIQQDSGTHADLVLGGDGTTALFRGDDSSHVYLSNAQGEVGGYQGSGAPAFFLQDGGHASRAPMAYRSDLDLLGFARQQAWCTVQHPDNPGVVATCKPSMFPGLSSADRILTVAACPINPNLIYAGSEQGAIFRSTDGGTSWSSLVGLAPPALPQLPPIWAVSPSPANCADVLVGVGYENTILVNGQVFPSPSIQRGSDGFISGDRLFHKIDAANGDPWTGVHGILHLLPKAPVFTIARDPSAPDTRWFVGTDVGVFRTDDGGNSWSNATAPLGLPNVPVRTLRLSGDGKILYAGTFGRGVWRMDTSRPAPTVFGIRGVVTLGSKASPNVRISASGAGRVRKFLRNVVTAGVGPTTAPINVPESATISSAVVKLVADATSAALLTPAGTTLAMVANGTSGGLPLFQLTSASASALVGQNINGQWKFSVSKTFRFPTGAIIRLTPRVSTASVDFQFTNGVSALTGLDGEYTIEYLIQGAHTVTMGSTNKSINLTSHQTNVNFAIAPLGVSRIDPKMDRIDVHELLTYALGYTVTDGRPWRDLATVQVRFRDNNGTILWIDFDTAAGTLSLIDPKTGRAGPAFIPGSHNRLETPAATLELDAAELRPNVPDPSSVQLILPLSFKPAAEHRLYDVEVIATDRSGRSQGPDLVGTLQVGDIPVTALPPVPVEPDPGSDG